MFFSEIFRYAELFLRYIQVFSGSCLAWRVTSNHLTIMSAKEALVLAPQSMYQRTECRPEHRYQCKNVHCRKLKLAEMWAPSYTGCWNFNLEGIEDVCRVSPANQHLSSNISSARLSRDFSRTHLAPFPLPFFPPYQPSTESPCGAGICDRF